MLLMKIVAHSSPNTSSNLHPVCHCALYYNICAGTVVLPTDVSESRELRGFCNPQEEEKRILKCRESGYGAISSGKPAYTVSVDADKDAVSIELNDLYQEV